MTATAVIEESAQRFPKEQSRKCHLSGKELAALARKMVDSNDPAEVKRLREEIHRGFYGE